MDNEFYTLLTDRGMAKIASALADKKQLHLQKDGGLATVVGNIMNRSPARPNYATGV